MKRHRLATLCALLLVCSSSGVMPRETSGQTASLPYKDASLPIEKRVDDLISRMTLEEKVSQLMNASRAIERLGIPEYEWWNEGLGAQTPDEGAFPARHVRSAGEGRLRPHPVFRSLQGIKHLFLKPGERRRFSFTLAPRQLTLIDDEGRRVLEPGEFMLSVGGKQPGFTGRTDAQTTGVVSARLVVAGKVTEIKESAAKER